MNDCSEFLKPDNCILLLVDIQKVMLDRCAEAGPLIKNTAALIEIAKIMTIPVFFSVHNSEKLGGVLPELVGGVTEPRVYNKLEFSCLENEAILRALQGTGRKTLILAGLEAHVCIFHTGAHALRLGFTVHIASDAVSSRKNTDKDIGLRRLERAGVVISSTEMVIFELLNRAGTDNFREALPLLKTL